MKRRVRNSMALSSKSRFWNQDFGLAHAPSCPGRGLVVCWRRLGRGVSMRSGGQRAMSDGQETMDRRRAEHGLCLRAAWFVAENPRR